ncbi:Ig-like domain-containing protein [Paenarthrobacter nitroguajacolicus]|uniref:Ig-like domain-containing protein n=1 Tax=Paenarthrobacter nitroguajacolicus TaxID=211146 RepID=UPI0040544D6D
MIRHRKSMVRQSSTSVTMGRWNRIVVIVVGILFVSWGGPAASAFWSTVSSSLGAAKADTVNQGAKPVTTVGLAGSVTVSWAATMTAAGRPATGYSIARYASATGGTKVAAVGTCAGTVAALTCTETAPTGTWYYTVTPMISLWQGTESLRSTGSVVDATAPTAPIVNAPGYVIASTATNISVTGTAEANSSVVLTVTDAGSAHTVTKSVTANGSGNWTASALNLTTLNDGTITYSARATDAAGNTGAAGTDTSTKDVIAPTVTGVQLSNGGSINGRIERDDVVTLTFSEPLDASAICSAWTSDTSTQTLNGNGQVTATVNSSDNLTVTSSGCSTLKYGTVALGGDYETSGSMTFSGSGSNASVLQWNPVAKTLVLTLGTMTGTGNSTAQPLAAAKFSPASGLTDIAGNPLATTQFTSPTPSRF